MSVVSEELELDVIINHICDYMADMVSRLVVPKGEPGSAIRRQIGEMRAQGLQFLLDKTFGTKLWECFESVRALPLNSDSVALMRHRMYDEIPTGIIAVLVVNTTILYCLTSESILLTRQEFTNRAEINEMMKRMKIGFDQARDAAADRSDSATYQSLSYLAGSLINHLNSTALRLPDIVRFNYQQSLPSLYLVQRIYQDTKRSDELEQMNDVVHPLFMPRSIDGLSL